MRFILLALALSLGLTGPALAARLTIDDVRNIRVIATGAAIAENRNRLSRLDQPREFVDREVRPLARAVAREKPQARDRHCIQVMKCMAHQLAGLLGGGIRRDRMIDVVRLAERHFLIVAVYAAAAGEYEPPNGVPPKTRMTS